MPKHFDIIIIGTGAGGGTLAATLAPSGKRILLLERGGFVPREKDNWSTRAVNIEGKYNAGCHRDGCSRRDAAASGQVDANGRRIVPALAFWALAIKVLQDHPPHGLERLPALGGSESRYVATVVALHFMAGRVRRGRKAGSVRGSRGCGLTCPYACSTQIPRAANFEVGHDDPPRRGGSVLGGKSVEIPPIR